MKYRLKKETKPTLPTYGKYKAVAVHSQTVSSDEILKEAAQNSPLDEGVLIAALIRLSEVVNRHLRAGDRVRLQDWGLMKLEIESDKVDNLKDFSVPRSTSVASASTSCPKATTAPRPSTKVSPSRKTRVLKKNRNIVVFFS